MATGTNVRAHHVLYLVVSCTVSQIDISSARVICGNPALVTESRLERSFISLRMRYVVGYGPSTSKPDLRAINDCYL